MINESSDNEPEMNLYTDGDGQVYEGKLFETFVLMKPVYSGKKGGVQKVTLNEFGRHFDDFYGDREAVRAYLRGAPVEITIQ